MESLKGKIVLITGATGGIGSNLISVFAQEGAKLLLVSQNNNRLKKIKSKFKTITEVNDYKVDLRDEKQILDLVKRVENHYGYLDILINNAASFFVHKIAEFPTEEFDNITTVNLRAVFLLTKNLIPLLKRKKGAHIINIASISAHHGWNGGGPYCASKFALMGLSEVLREELKPNNIRVSVVSPGQVDTNMSILPKRHPDRKKMLRGEDIADLVMYIAKLPDYAYMSEAIMRSVRI